MRDKFKMTVTINRLTSPKLHEALSGCPTDRERAAALRVLAESALAGLATILRQTPTFTPASVSTALETTHVNSFEQIRVLATDNEQAHAGDLSDAIMGDLDRFFG
jgi:hypothetical protein